MGEQKKPSLIFTAIWMLALALFCLGTIVMQLQLPVFHLGAALVSALLAVLILLNWLKLKTQSVSKQAILLLLSITSYIFIIYFTNSIIGSLPKSASKAGYFLILHTTIGFISTMLVIRLLNQIVYPAYETTTQKTIASIIKIIINIIIIISASILIMEYVYQKDTTALLAASGLISLIIGLAIKSNLSNLFSGLFISIEQPFSEGDWIVINSIKGQVATVSWRSIVLNTLANTTVTIPNSTMSTSSITNLSRQHKSTVVGYRVTNDIYIHPEHDPQEAIKLIETALSKTQLVDGRSDFSLQAAKLRGFTDKGIHISIQFDCTSPSYEAAQTHAVMQNVHHTLIQAGIRTTSGQLYQKVKEDAGVVSLQTHRRKTEDFNLAKPSNQNAYMDRIKRAVFIKQVEIFSQLAKTDLEYLAEKAKINFFSPQETFIKQGEQGNSLFIICSGVVGIYGTIGKKDNANKQSKELELARLGAGEFVGEMSLLTGSPRMATVRSLTLSSAIEITKKNVEAIFKGNPDLLTRISQIMAERQIQNEKTTASAAGNMGSSESLVKKLEDKIKNFFGIN